MNRKKAFHNILVVRTDRIGDVVLTTPAIEALRIAYPQARISMMVASQTKDIVEGNPFLDEVIVYDSKGKDKGFFGFWRFVMNLRKKHFDLAVNYHLKNRINVMLFSAGIPCRIGFKNKKYGFLLTKQYPDQRIDGTKHESQYCLELLKNLGIYGGALKLHVSVKEESEVWASKFFEAYGIRPNDKTIAVNPGASCFSRRWPPEKFGQVIKRLIEKYQAKVILIGARDSQVIAKEVVRTASKDVIDMTEKTSITQLISLLKRCSLLISNDSGPCHLAAGVGTPVISIFSRNQPGLSDTRWRPLGKHDIVLHRNVGCKVCLAHYCQRNFQCLLSISVEDVLKAVEEILRTSQQQQLS